MTNKKVNLDGVEPKLSEAYDSIITYKQKLLFEKSLLEVSCTLSSKELKKYTEDDINEMLSKKMSEYLFRYTDIDKIEKDDSTTFFNKKLMVMSLIEFKHLIDYFIKTLSDEQIQEIRKKTKRQQKKSE